MTYQRLGKTEEAAKYLDQLRTLMNDPKHSRDADNRAFLAETEALFQRGSPKKP